MVVLGVVVSGVCMTISFCLSVYFYCIAGKELSLVLLVPAYIAFGCLLYFDRILRRVLRSTERS